MIKRLRNRFIRIATLSVAAVMLLLTVLVNTANFASTDSDLTQTLRLIEKNQGTIPLPARSAAPEEQTPPPPADGADTPESGVAAPEAPDRKPADRGGHDGPFGPETAFSTRFFVLRYTEDGTLLRAELDRIAAVTEDDVDEYLAVAVQRGEGFGYYSGYKYLVTADGEGEYSAIFLDCYQAMRMVRTVALWSLAADAGCILLVFLLIVLLSRRAIDPVVRSAEQQKQFITDASHELKTPITVIATSLRVLELETGKQKWIDKAMAQTEKLTELVNSLVTLSRMDEEESPLKPADFCISDAVSETAESFRDFAQSRGHTLAVNIVPDLTYHGDEYAVRQLVSILLDNAVKYALPDTPIAVTLEKARRGVVLRTANRCDTLVELDTAKLFDRFYRADPSRGTGGFGIGLSIARGIAEGHHGSISARLDGDTITFTAELK